MTVMSSMARMYQTPGNLSIMFAANGPSLRAIFPTVKSSMKAGSSTTRTTAARRLVPRDGPWLGEAGRFTDPLYSPGSGSLISIYNTLIVDAIETDEESVLIEKCRWAEHIQRAAYESYVPSYAVSYDCLGDHRRHSHSSTPGNLLCISGFWSFRCSTSCSATAPSYRHSSAGSEFWAPSTPICSAC